MSATRAESLGASTIPLEIEAKIDEICDSFEDDLKARRRPDLDRLLRSIDPQFVERLTQELLHVALQYALDTGPGSGEFAKSTVRAGGHSSLHGLPTAAPAGPKCAAPSDPRVAGLAGEFGEYELLEELGRGGMGVVYRAYQKQVGRIVALKIISAGRLDRQDQRQRAVERFQTEVRAAARLNHENVVTVYEVGVFDGQPFYAMEFVAGSSLASLVRDAPLDVRRAVGYLAKIADAVEALHSAGVVHRDLKPSNLLIESSTDRPIVADFGLAKLLDTDNAVTLSGEVFGSPPYMAPEQALQSSKVGPAADIYSLGATLYHLITGRPPFHAATLAETTEQVLHVEPIPPRQLNSSILVDVETICLKCLQKDPTRRYSSAGDLAGDLRNVLAGRPILARPVGRVEKAWRWCQRIRALAGLMAACVLSLASASLVSGVMYRSERHAAESARQALAENRIRLSREILSKSNFRSGDNPLQALPWLVEALKVDQGTARESVDRVRIRSVICEFPLWTQLFTHQGPVASVAFDATGDRVLTASHDGTARLWSTSDGRCLQTFRHGAAIYEAKRLAKNRV